MNKSISKYTPNAWKYLTTMSLANQVAIAICVASVGFFLYWAAILQQIGLSLTHTTQTKLQQLDRNKSKKSSYQKCPAMKRCRAVENSKKPGLVLPKNKRQSSSNCCMALELCSMLSERKRTTTKMIKRKNISHTMTPTQK